MINKIIKCKNCGKEFTFTIGEQQFFKEKGFDKDPVRCISCRREKKQSKKNLN